MSIRLVALAVNLVAEIAEESREKRRERRKAQKMAERAERRQAIEEWLSQPLRESVKTPVGEIDQEQRLQSSVTSLSQSETHRSSSRIAVYEPFDPQEI